MVRTMEHGHEIFIALQKISILENPVSGFRFLVALAFVGYHWCPLISVACQRYIE